MFYLFFIKYPSLTVHRVIYVDHVCCTVCMQRLPLCRYIHTILDFGLILIFFL